jgi:hypothetical protein
MLLHPYSGSIIECDRIGSGIGVSGLYPPASLGYFYPPNDIWAVTSNENKEVSDQNIRPIFRHEEETSWPTHSLRNLEVLEP